MAATIKSNHIMDLLWREGLSDIFDGVFIHSFEIESFVNTEHPLEVVVELFKFSGVSHRVRLIAGSINYGSLMYCYYEF